MSPPGSRTPPTRISGTGTAGSRPQGGRGGLRSTKNGPSDFGRRSLRLPNAGARSRWATAPRRTSEKPAVRSAGEGLTPSSRTFLLSARRSAANGPEAVAVHPCVSRAGQLGHRLHFGQMFDGLAVATDLPTVAIVFRFRATLRLPARPEELGQLVRPARFRGCVTVLGGAENTVRAARTGITSSVDFRKIIVARFT